MVVAISKVGLALALIPMEDDSVWALVMTDSVLSLMQNSAVAAVDKVDSASALVQA